MKSGTHHKLTPQMPQNGLNLKQIRPQDTTHKIRTDDWQSPEKSRLCQWVITPSLNHYSVESDRAGMNGEMTQNMSVRTIDIQTGFRTWYFLKTKRKIYDQSDSRTNSLVNNTTFS
jgi:hypothetical protein